jgi:hypothetical protein
MEMQAHSRIKRYEILLDFFRDQVLFGLSLSQEDWTDRMELFMEILKMDLFLREDMKSRPAFVTKQSQINYKERYDLYRRQNKLVHIEEFTFDIGKAVAEGKAVREESTILFNYSDRDPITNSAEIIRL